MPESDKIYGDYAVNAFPRRMYEARCYRCKYVSPRRAYPGLVEGMVREHIAAKHRIPEPRQDVRQTMSTRSWTSFGR